MELFNPIYHDSRHHAQIRGADLDSYLARGWYRMHTSVFTISHLIIPRLTYIRRVWWLRYDVQAWHMRPSHRRLFRQNQRFRCELMQPFGHARELDDLYKRYYDSIDFTGYESVQTATFFHGELNPFDTRAWLLWDGDRLVAAGIFDVGADSAASILHFYDPEYKKFSFGRYLMLLTVLWCRSQQMRWYYPGYIIRGDAKMDYKLFLGHDSASIYDPGGPDGNALDNGAIPPTHEFWTPLGPRHLEVPDVIELYLVASLGASMVMQEEDTPEPLQ